MLFIGTIFIVAAAYLAGSVSFAIVICRIVGRPDPRTVGSGNPGATNAVRAGGKVVAILTLAGDIGKVLLPVLAARYFGLTDSTVALVGLAAFLGHLFPVWHGFRGGKGVASYFGFLLGTVPVASLAWAVTWLVAAGIFRYSSFAAMVSSALAPLFFWWQAAPPWLTAASAVMALLVLVRHHENIGRLLRGEEDRLFTRAQD